MSTPYDTGKVKIGLAYTKPNRYEPDRDMEMLQRGLIRPSRRHVEAYRKYRLACVSEALLWTASIGLFVVMLKAPAIWAVIATA